jgi:hypothetical protein
MLSPAVGRYILSFLDAIETGKPLTTTDNIKARTLARSLII